CLRASREWGAKYDSERQVAEQYKNRLESQTAERQKSEKQLTDTLAAANKRIELLEGQVKSLTGQKLQSPADSKVAAPQDDKPAVPASSTTPAAAASAKKTELRASGYSVEASTPQPSKNLESLSLDAMYEWNFETTTKGYTRFQHATWSMNEGIHQNLAFMEEFGVNLWTAQDRDFDMPIEFVRIACLLALAACASAATCNNTVCSMNPPDSCMGYTYEYCFNATTSTGYNGQICYYSSDCASYTKTDGDFSVKLSGQPPNIIGMYYSLIKNAIRTAYNNFCTSGTNYKICCPGAVSWANMNTSLTAMANNSEVMILSSKGSSVITSALSSQNVTVTVTVTTVGYSSSPANQVESSRFVVCATALMALVGFSLRRNL
uniref:SCP domain-containing protein n=2 Tax=Macrostomum lignano TaxID=282301 RepID=A0A1I8GH12_9PLAT